MSYKELERERREGEREQEKEMKNGKRERERLSYRER